MSILGAFWALGALLGPNSVPRAPQEHSRAPQERPRCVRERPKSVQERPKSVQEAPKRRPGDPKRRPRDAQEAPRGPKRVPKGSPRVQIRHQIWEKSFTERIAFSLGLSMCIFVCFHQNSYSSNKRAPFKNIVFSVVFLSMIFACVTICMSLSRRIICSSFWYIFGPKNRATNH